MMDDKRFIAPQTRPTLCWSCARACGGCSWTERDPVTHAIRFEPVKGWEAEKTTINGSKSEHGEKCYRYTTDSYRVVRCPMYVPDRRTRAKKRHAGMGHAGRERMKKAADRRHRSTATKKNTHERRFSSPPL